MSFILYDRYFSLDEKTGTLKTFWRVIGNKYNSVVQLHETYPVQTLNCFNQNIASLYIFCKPTQSQEFEKHHLVDIHKQYGNNLRIFKFVKQLTVAVTSCSLMRNLDNIQNVFMMHTRTKSNIDQIETKEAISHRVTYKFSFNNEKTRNEIVSKIKFYNLTAYPDIEMFVPFDDECELFLNHIFPTNRQQDNSQYTYMTVIENHYMNFVPILESFHGLIQLINSRNISHNVLMVNNREVVKNPRVITDMFLDNVPIVDIFMGRVYENEQCIEFHSHENEITFIMLKLFIFKRSQYIVFMNRKYQAIPIAKNEQLANIIVCDGECDLLTKFFNIYTNGLVFKILNMDIHFIMATQRYKSNSYAIMYRIIMHNLWSRFASHCIISEDGKCIRFNRNSIILFDNIDNCNEVVTNYKILERDVVYLPELYADSTASPDATLHNHMLNIKPEKACKYVEIRKYLKEQRPVNTMSMYQLIEKIYTLEETQSSDYNTILESIIELSNRIRVPITLLYSMSVAQIAYRLIFYNSIRNGFFLIMEKRENMPFFYQCENYEGSVDALKKLSTPQRMKVFQHYYDQNDANEAEKQPYLFQNLIKRFIPVYMTGNLVENYFSFFCPDKNRLPIVASLVENESELLCFRNAIVWARQQLVSGRSIVSFDFSLYNSSIMALFGVDFHNCALLYGFELKNFFYSIFPTRNTFVENDITFLQLPHTFIMDNDTLRVHNIITYQDIGSLNDHACYIVVMRFIVTEMMQRHNKNYRPLCDLFYENIIDMSKYRTRLMLHKNILNSICGMLSTYQINTTMLNIVNALSRKIIMWVVANCISLRDDHVPVSFIEHEYDVTSSSPKNLLAIENDSFTFIYDYAPLNYERMEENMRTVDTIRRDILDKLCHQLATCTQHSAATIAQIVNLKVNFVTGNLFQLMTGRYFYIAPPDSSHEKARIVCNERNNRNIQKALSYLNLDDNLIRVMKRNDNLKLSYLKRTHNFTETRRLLVWYLMQHHRSGSVKNNDQMTILNNLRTLNNFVERDNFQRREINQYLSLLFGTLRVTNIEEYFLKLLSNAVLNTYFLRYNIPEHSLFDDIQLPSDKKTLILNCVQIFFKLYEKFATVKKNPSAAGQTKT